MHNLMREKRKSLGQTQTDLFLATGIPPWRLSLIERGIPPRGEESFRIADALGTTPDELFSSKDCHAGN